MPSNHLILCCPLLLLLSIFLGLIWKFNCKCVYTGKNIVYIELSTICSFRHPLGGLKNLSHTDKGGLLCCLYLFSPFLSSLSLLPLPQYGFDNLLHNNNDNYNRNYYYSSQHLYVCNRVKLLYYKVPNISHSILTVPVKK